MPKPDFDLYLITDRTLTGDRNLVTVLEQALDGGVDAIQLREKDLCARELFSLAEEIHRLTERYSARFFLNDRIDVALAVGADGVQLGSASVPIAAARRLLGSMRMIGASVHTLTEAEDAYRSGADFLVFGPIYFTPSKARYGPPQGLKPLEELLAKISLPVYAIGGLKSENIGAVKRVGARGIALISAIIRSAEPAATTREILGNWRACKR